MDATLGALRSNPDSVTLTAKADKSGDKDKADKADRPGDNNNNNNKRECLVRVELQVSLV